MLLAIGTVVAAGSVFFFGRSDVPGSLELLIACGREPWQSYWIMALIAYPVAQGAVGIAVWKLKAAFPARLLTVCAASVVLSVLFATTFAVAQSAVG